jgi:hypothetical protein
MFKTIFLIIVTVVVSALTTAGLLYRYTKPVQSVDRLQRLEPSAAIEAAVKSEGLNIKMVQGAFDKLLGGKSAVKTPEVIAETVVAAMPKVEAVAQQQRYFDHELLVQDMSSLSEKLQKFNDILSGEIQRLKSNPEPQP